MRNFSFVFIVLLTSLIRLNAQQHISGKITSTKAQPLEGVSIAIKDSYEGTTSDKDGHYQVMLPDTGRFIISFSMAGYNPIERQVDLTGKPVVLDVALKEAITDLKAVVITAGTFEASDKKRTTILKSVDVVTTAGQQADIAAALNTLPGTQQVGEQEGLFVRGGTGYETKVFIDGMMVTNPFYSSVPGIAQRGRFSPLLFKGTIFNTGGYSAQYGQALSSALILETIDFPARSEVNAIISSAQMSFLGQYLHPSKKVSAGVNVNYNNLAPYYHVVPQKFHYDKAPEAINTEFNWRKRIKKGIIKFYTYCSANEVGFDRPSLDVDGFDEKFHINNKNSFTNLTYSGQLPNQWSLYAGTSLSTNKDKIKMTTANTDTTIAAFAPELSNRTLQGKIVVTKNFPGLSKLYIGTEGQHITDKIVAKDSIDLRRITDEYFAGLVETDIYFSSDLVSRVGLRYEYSSLLDEAVLSPRVSVAYKINDKSQLSFSYGTFYQKPATNYLLRKSALDFSKAAHYILNFQKVANGQTTFRVEAFEKSYKSLIRTGSDDPNVISNEGSGYARGIEVFWRDKTNIKNLDYWVSYSFLDTKRKHLDYPSLTQPSFAAKHTLSIVAKKWVAALSTYFSATYNYASGRPYYNPNRSLKEFMTDRTMDYHSLGLQANYLKTFGKVNAVFILNVGNALGNKQVFGYRYAGKVNAAGNYEREAVTPMANRFVFLGAYLSIGSDRRKEILD